jgi:hypothetical protein
MGSPGDVDGRLTKLEKQQGDASKAQDALKKELDKQNTRFMETLDVFVDFSDAITYLQKYLIHFTLESVEHALMISSATTKFAAFLKLPPTSSSINLYVDFAFTAVAAVFPAVRLLKLLDGVSKEASVALAIAKASATAPQRLATVIVQGVPKAGETADVLKKANDTRMKALAALKSDPATGSVAELRKLDSSKAAIRYFVETATRAAQVFDNVADVIAAEFYARVTHPDIQRRETIFDITKRILVTHDFLTPDELDQLEATYIWEMIASYCKQNDNVVFVKQTGWGAQDGVQIRGLNNGQLETLMDLFGPNAPRGKYFAKPIVAPYASIYLQYIGTKTVREDTGRMPPR